MSFLKLFSFSLVLFFALNLFAYPNYSEAVKEKKIYPMGEKIFLKRCPHLKLSTYNSYDALTHAISSEKLCGTLNIKYQEAVALYLWDVKREKKEGVVYPKIHVTKEQKCPVCGMFLYKYPNWVSEIVYADGKKLYFDGMKDLMKYYFKHPKNIKLILTQEYYKQKTINAKNAYFVLGSDVYGPMGNELIPLKDKKSAENFLLDHRGKKNVKFDEVTEDMVYKLDE